MTIHQAVKPIVAKMLHVNEKHIEDSTDITSLNQVDLMVALVQKIGVAHGLASGAPRTYGELISKLEEVIAMGNSPNKVVIKVVAEPTQN